MGAGPGAGGGAEAAPRRTPMGAAACGGTVHVHPAMEQQEKQQHASQQPPSRVVGNFCIEALLGPRRPLDSPRSDSSSVLSPAISPGCEGDSPPPPPPHHLQHGPPQPAVVLSRFYPPPPTGPHQPPAHVGGLYYPGSTSSAFHPLLGEMSRSKPPDGECFDFFAHFSM